MRHESDDVHRLGGLGIGGFDLRVGEHDIVVLFDRIAFDDVLLGNLLPRRFVDFAVADSGVVALVKQVEIQPLRRGLCVEQLHAAADESEPQCALPDPPSHRILPRIPLVGTRNHCTRAQPALARLSAEGYRSLTYRPDTFRPPYREGIAAREMEAQIELPVEQPIAPFLLSGSEGSTGDTAPRGTRPASRETGNEPGCEKRR